MNALSRAVLVAGLALACSQPLAAQTFLQPIRVEQGVVTSQPPARWMGVVTLPATEALRSQLKLEKNQGLVVQHVAPGSPAADAGLQKHDVLVTAGGKGLTASHDLVQAVRASGGDSIEVELFRQGEKQTVRVAPAKRPGKIAAPQIELEMDFEKVPQDWQELEAWLKKFGPQQDSKPFRLQWFGPGAVVQSKARTLPDGISISITRSGNEPAKIVVKRGDKQWEVTEKELDKLPEDLRPHVQHMLPGQAASVGIDMKMLRGARRTSSPLKIKGDVQQQIDELRKSLDELREKLQQSDSKREELLRRLLKDLE